MQKSYILNDFLAKLSPVLSNGEDPNRQNVRVPGKHMSTAPQSRPRFPRLMFPIAEELEKRKKPIRPFVRVKLGSDLYKVAMCRKFIAEHRRSLRKHYSLAERLETDVPLELRCN